MHNNIMPTALTSMQYSGKCYIEFSIACIIIVDSQITLIIDCFNNEMKSNLNATVE